MDLVGIETMDPMHGQGDCDLVALLMAVQIVVHRYHIKGRRSWTLHLSLMSHVVTLMLMESRVDKK